MCAACHALKVGDRVGPDLYGVTKRRPHNWLVEFIQSPQKMRQRQDPVALALAAKFKGVRMPNLGLTEIDATDLVSYLDTQSKWLDAQRVEAAQAMPPHQHNHNHKH